MDDGYLQVMDVNAQNGNTWTRFGGEFYFIKAMTISSSAHPGLNKLSPFGRSGIELAVDS